MISEGLVGAIGGSGISMPSMAQTHGGLLYYVVKVPREEQQWYVCWLIGDDYHGCMVIIVKNISVKVIF